MSEEKMLGMLVYEKEIQRKGKATLEQHLDWFHSRAVHVPVRPIIGTAGRGHTLLGAPSLTATAADATTSAERGVTTANPTSTIFHKCEHLGSIKIKGVADVTYSILDV
jgi:hypothetical protein